MPLPGYPKTFDHPKITKLVEGQSVSGGIYMFIKSMGDTPAEWIKYQVKYPNSANPDTTHTISVNVGNSLHGPFSYVKHHDEGSGAIATGIDAYTLVHEVEV